MVSLSNHSEGYQGREGQENTPLLVSLSNQRKESESRLFLSPCGRGRLPQETQVRGKSAAINQ
jgi:hypothetical protein